MICRCFTFLGEDQDEVPQTTSNGEQKEKGTKNGDPNGSKSSDFKGHLNGLYNGLANIMTTTCDLGPDSRSQVAPFAVEKAVHNIMFIKHHMKRQDEFDAVSIFKCALSCWMYPTPKRIIWVTLALTDLLCMLNWGTQWTMVSYLKK